MEPFSEVIKSDKPVLVDFYADWCGPCKAMTPVIKEVAKGVEGKGKVIKINIDKNINAAQTYQIQAVPTFIIFKNGSIIWRHSGMIDKASLMTVLNQHAPEPVK
jgi:thioredoxin 1